MDNPVPSSEGLSPTAGASRATDQRETWLDKPVPNRLVGAFHAGRLLNLFRWHLNQAYVLRNEMHFARAMKVFDRMVQLSNSFGDDADELLVPRLECIRLTCKEAWTSESAFEELDDCRRECDDEMGTTPEAIRFTRSLVWAQPNVRELKKCWQEFVSASEKQAFAIGESVDQLVRRKDVVRFMWKVELSPARSEAAAPEENLALAETAALEANGTSEPSGVENPCANHSPQPGELPIDNTVVNKLADLCSPLGILKVVSRDWHTLEGQSKDQLVKLVEAVDKRLREQLGRDEGDGPREGEPTIFRWHGTPYILTRREWKLACALWSADGGKMDFAQIGHEVWDNDFTKRTTIRVQLTRLNKRLANFGIPVSWTVSGEHVHRTP